LTIILCALFTSHALAHDWQPVTGEEKLKALFSDTVMTATLKGEVTAKATYNATSFRDCGRFEVTLRPV